MKAASGNAPHLVQGDRSQVVDAIARLFEELASGRRFETLVALHTPTGQKPRAREWTGGLFDDQDPPRVIDAGDDRADPRRVGHAR